MTDVGSPDEKRKVVIESEEETKKLSSDDFNPDGYLPLDGRFDALPTWEESKTDLLQWMDKCTTARGYPLFKTKHAGMKFPLNSVLVLCFGGERIKPEHQWIKDVPDDIIERLEAAPDSYDWLREYAAKHDPDPSSGGSSTSGSGEREKVTIKEAMKFAIKGAREM